jgi:hypothetical protein
VTAFDTVWLAAAVIDQENGIRVRGHAGHRHRNARAAVGLCGEAIGLSISGPLRRGRERSSFEGVVARKWIVDSYDPQTTDLRFRKPFAQQYNQWLKSPVLQMCCVEPGERLRGGTRSVVCARALKSLRPVTVRTVYLCNSPDNPAWPQHKCYRGRPGSLHR